MTSEVYGDMFESDSADTCTGQILFMSMGGRAKGQVCVDPGARTPIGVLTISFYFFIISMIN